MFYHIKLCLLLNRPYIGQDTVFLQHFKSFIKGWVKSGNFIFNAYCSPNNHMFCFCVWQKKLYSSLSSPSFRHCFWTSKNFFLYFIYCCGRSVWPILSLLTPYAMVFRGIYLDINNGGFKWQHVKSPPSATKDMSALLKC